MSTDTLSEVLRAVRLTGAVFFDVNVSASTWVAEAPSGNAVGPQVLPGAEHVIEYHVVVEGACWAGLVGQPPVRLEQGDIVVFPQGDAHVVSSAPGMRGEPDLNQFQLPAGMQLPIVLNMGAGEQVHTKLVCGFLGCDARPFNPLLATLPRVMHVRAGRSSRDDRSSTSHTGVLVQLALAESKQRRAGGECALARLSELLFVEVVRDYIAQQPREGTGWLGGLRDPIIGRALAALHDRPAYAWTLDELAKEVGASRSVLAERFAHFTGVPPMQYLTQWRMQLASSLLAAGFANIAQIAAQVGYGSEAAFSRAYKRLVGVAPAQWRQAQRGESARMLTNGAEHA